MHAHLLLMELELSNEVRVRAEAKITNIMPNSKKCYFAVRRIVYTECDLYKDDHEIIRTSPYVL